MGNVNDFIDAMSEMGVRITGVSWWCWVNGEHTPCGMGGPKNKYGDGWYSEIEMGKTYDFQTNNDIKEYLNSFKVPTASLQRARMAL